MIGGRAAQEISTCACPIFDRCVPQLMANGTLIGSGFYNRANNIISSSGINFQSSKQ